jgi:ABC-2 type transport system permease protein
MDVQSSWAVTRKDFSVFRRKRYVLYSLFAVPLIVSILLPVVLHFLITSKGYPPAGVEIFLGAFSFFWVIIAAGIPVSLASYSIVGEKVEKSLEPLLATPMTDGEILLGKSLAAFLPALASTYAGAIIYMVLADLVTYDRLGYLFFPNWTMGAILLIATLACLLSVEANIIFSSRINDIRASQQLGFLVILPFAAVYVLSELNIVSYNDTNLLIISAVTIVADVILFYLTKAVFRREEILTKWK